MTDQRPNYVIYENVKYWISSISTKAPLFKPSVDVSKDSSLDEEAGIQRLRSQLLKMLPCVRGNVQTYMIKDQEFLLDSIMLMTDSPPLPINEQVPVKPPPSWKDFDYHYKNLNLKTNFSGKILIRHEEFSDKIITIEKDIVISIIDESDPLFAQLAEQKIWYDYMTLYRSIWR